MMQRYYRLVMIEDSEDDAELAEHCIRRAGLQCNITRLTRVDELEPTLDRIKPDAIVCDLNLPGQSGLEALRITKTHLQETPFIFLTGYASPAHQEIAKSRGATAIVEKGTFDELVDALKRTLGKEPAAQTILRKVP